MAELPIKREDIRGIEAKHITYVVDQHKGAHDCLITKEVIHLKDGTRISRLKEREDWERNFYVTKPALRNHKEKKSYEFLENLTEYRCREMDMPRLAARLTENFKAGPHPRIRQVNRSPYLYGTDISSTALLKNEYRTRAPDLVSFNLVAGGDIETNVVREFMNGKDVIIMMSVSHKENVRLVYLKDWVTEFPNVVDDTLAMCQKLIPDLIASRKLNIEVLVAETAAEVVTLCVDKLHEWKPDFWSFWNMGFDIGKIEKCLHEAGIDPKHVFSDASVQDKYKYFEYREGSTSRTTASGKTMAKAMEDMWNWVITPATFQPIDAMSVYRNTRITNGKDPSYALTAILKKELNVNHSVEIEEEGDIEKFLKKAEEIRLKNLGGFAYYYLNNRPVDKSEFSKAMIGDELEIEIDYDKLKFPETDHLFGLDWHVEMQRNYKIQYGVYNIVDSIRLEQLDEKIKDLALSISSYSKNSDYRNFNSNPKRLIDDMHFWYLRQEVPKVIGSSSDELKIDLDDYVTEAKGYIITLASFMQSASGLDCIAEFPGYMTLIFAAVADLDLVATYPNASQLLNIERETCVMELSKIEGLTDLQRRSIGVNLTGGKTNAIDICQKTMGMPPLDVILERYIAQRGKS